MQFSVQPRLTRMQQLVDTQGSWREGFSPNSAETLCSIARVIACGPVTSTTSLIVFIVSPAIVVLASPASYYSVSMMKLGSIFSNWALTTSAMGPKRGSERPSRALRNWRSWTWSVGLDESIACAAVRHFNASRCLSVAVQSQFLWVLTAFGFLLFKDHL